MKEIEPHAGEHQTHGVGHVQAPRQDGHQRGHEQEKAELREIRRHAPATNTPGDLAARRPSSLKSHVTAYGGDDDAAAGPDTVNRMRPLSALDWCVKTIHWRTY